MVKKYIIWYAVWLHAVWGVALLCSDSPLGITAIHSLGEFLSRYVIAVLYLAISAAAAWGLIRLGGRSSLMSLTYILPQQFLLVMSAYGATAAIVNSQFADCVIRPRWFLIADQSPSVIAAVLHTLAILEHYGRDFWHGLRKKIA